MNTESQNPIIEKIAGIVDWLTQKRRELVSPDTADALHTEIYQLQQSLSSAPTRPTRTIRKRESMEPVTEQQKIMDLAG